MEGGPAMQMPVAHNMLESEMIGAIKIKDGLFIGDELASTVSHPPPIIVDAISSIQFRDFSAGSYIDYFCHIRNSS